MIKVDESDPVGEVEPSFPYRDVQMRRNLDMKELYEIQEEVGRGKFGIVYRCREKSSGLQLAAKLVSTPRREDRRNVEREVDIMRILQHPRLIQLYDAFDNGRTMCVVLEMIEGGELFERVIDDDFILTEKACTVFMRQICEAMEFIHSKHILHLDMKPENILCLTKTGNRVKIIDFGLARKFDPDKKLQVLFGTPEFVAPEIVNFEQIGFGTDMWSIGVICYVLLSGLSPFMGETDVETMSNVTISKYDYDDEAFNDISDEAKDFIDKLLVKDKDRRMSAAQCVAHPWLKRKPVQPPPPAEELDMSKENLRVFVERWNEHPNSPYLFDQSCQSILPCMPAKVKSETSLRGLSPSPCGSLTSSSSESSTSSCRSEEEVAKPSFVGSPAPFVANTPPKYHLERLQTFERRASDSSCVVNRAANDSETRVNLADEIRKLSDKLFEMASLLNTPSVAPDVTNNNLPGSSFTVGNSRPVPFPPPAPSDDSQPSWRRTKFRVSNMNRDVPLPPKPPAESGYQKPPTVGNFPPRPQPETFPPAAPQDTCRGGDITKDLLLQLLNKWDDQQQGANNRRASFSGGRKSVSMEWSEEESLGQRTMNSLATYFQSSRTVDKKSSVVSSQFQVK